MSLSYIMDNSPINFSRGDQIASESSPLGFMDYIYKYSKQDKPEAKFLDDLFGGGSSGYGHVKSCGIDLAILTTALAALGAMAFVLYSKITMNKGRRRKRRELFKVSTVEKWDYNYLLYLREMFLSGMLNFTS